MSEKLAGLGAMRMVSNVNIARITSLWFLGISILLIAGLFLPWTQNINGTGQVTTLLPGQRPQPVTTAIAGSVAKWYVREGELVEKGDTILYLTEVKDKFFDPALVERTENQVKAKAATMTSYQRKIEALDKQLIALQETMELKLKQAENKVQQARLKVISDSTNLEAEKINYEVAKQQYERQQKLYDEGLKSLTDLEARRLKFQEAQAKLISAQNKLLTSENELINAQIELNSIRTQYSDKLSKTESERYQAMSSMFTSEGDMIKLQSEFTNFSIRGSFYYVVAPQAGYITKTLASGIGEVVKEGQTVATIVPSEYDPAAEMYVRPVDLPLIHNGEKVRLMFDGWPALVFSGWPTASFGTFGGVVVAVDNVISPNGKYRILVAPDPEQEPWPEQIRAGSGIYGWALLKDVPIWYELWRQLNGFPPDYYLPEKGEDTKSAKK